MIHFVLVSAIQAGWGNGGRLIAGAQSTTTALFQGETHFIILFMKLVVTWGHITAARILKDTRIKMCLGI